jgi:hypothetical protein
MTLEETLVSVWRQALVERAGEVELAVKNFSVRSTARRGLRQVDFTFEGRELSGLEQNPETKTRWAQLACGGKRVMQFLQGGRYMAVVVDGKVTLYGKSQGNSRRKT